MGICLCVCLCVCVCVFVISNQSTSKKPHVSDLSKLDAFEKSSGGGINIYSSGVNIYLNMC